LALICVSLDFNFLFISPRVPDVAFEQFNFVCLGLKLSLDISELSLQVNAETLIVSETHASLHVLLLEH
jgi:hypothetical protein